ncbi:hypothetical protein TH61_04605 [Rufibacter sp. DG15C]|uniref:hypothetical protein n=1 Tax=Rufibacter sp. DG15C TaxID=1379909 RepID=UPI00078E44B5|nr:hypothetical protein [Rufibacter sp. DG15C]AMM50599.1 hypothetical protein TH61_04605 [Rufibacter sp. DG15C]
MKKVTRVAAAALVALSFGFASCESKTADKAEETVETAGDEMGDAANEAGNDIDNTLESRDTITVQDTTVDDGVADKKDQ